MSARVTASGVQLCLHAAIVALVDRTGTGRIAGELGIDPATVRRHKAAGGWSDTEISALIAFELQEAGSSTIVAALAEHHNAATERTGEAVKLRSDLVRVLQDDAELDQVVLRNVDKTTPEGRRAVRELLGRRRAHDDELLADLEATDRKPSA